MIITCEKCSTKFNLDDSLINESGSKVRCSVCKNVFIVYTQDTDTSKDDEMFEITDFDSDKIDDDTSDEADFNFGDDPVSDEIKEFDDTQSDMLSSDGLTEDTKTLEEEKDDQEEEHDSHETKDSHTDYVTAIDETQIISEENTLIEKLKKNTNKRKKFSFKLFAMILFVILIIVGSVYVVSAVKGYKIYGLSKISFLSNIKIPNIDFLKKYFLKPVEEKKDVEPIVDDKNTEHRFVINSNSGNFFIISGNIKNLLNFPIKHVEVQGILLAENNVPKNVKNAFCGNIIPEKTLLTGTIEEIDKALKNIGGKDDLNVNIEPNATIPFMLVFSDLPEKLQNFTIKVIRFEKVINEQ